MTSKTMELARRPSDLSECSRAAASSRSWDTPQHQMDEESDEETEEDERVSKLDSRFLATPGHIRGEGSCDVNVGREAGGGGEARLRGDGEYDEDEGECGSGDQRENVGGGASHCDGTTEQMEWDRVAASGGVEYGGPGGSEMEDRELKDKGGDVGVSAGLTSKRGGKCTAEESPTPTAPEKQVRRKALDEARVVLDASQGTRGEPNVKRKSSARICKTSQPKNLVWPSRRQKSDDSSDDNEGVAPRLLSLPDDVEHETKKPSAINMTQCYFLEKDEEGKKRRDPSRVVIDAVQILRIPDGDIAFNQRSLNMAILAGLDAAIKSSTGPRGENDPAAWEPPELVLAPITPLKDDPDRQGTRVLPKDFDPDRADEYFYYPVAGQHTAEAMKRAVKRDSAAVDVFGFRNEDREAYGGYHKAQVGAFAMFVAQCEQLKFTTNRIMLTYDDYSNLANATDAWYMIESDKETETSDLDIEEQVKRSREGMQSVPACSVQNENPERGPTNSGGASSPARDVTNRASSIDQMQTDSSTPLLTLQNVLIHDNRRGLQGKPPSGGNADHDMLADADEDDLAVPDPSPKLIPGDDIPDHIVQDSAQPYFIHDKVPETTSKK
ncbi:hypothetical protein CBR_g3608 [Chara braunii]|uniref:Uncharacterized protein n=1 Tax=Chara braunii TaxID=69332 RepID=A0A388KFU5_CHABU|nr:hypothetical protein CBR_g3608 [Chara braunii]|eukprot:GBG68909.1 hypothetical protein CBR_g3608 [Chara braunii]